MANKYDAKDVAEYFIYLGSQNLVGDGGEREGVTNLKLQKILYLAQAYFLSKLGKPLFADQIEAWEFGPVVPSVYHRYKKHISNPIILDKEKNKIADSDKEHVRKVWDAFGGYSAGKLVDITHAHTPWKEAFASSSKVITKKAIIEYYTPLLRK